MRGCGGPRGGQEPRTGLPTSSPRASAAYCTPAAAPPPPPPGRAVRGSRDPWHLAPSTAAGAAAHSCQSALLAPRFKRRARSRRGPLASSRGRGCSATRVRPTLKPRSRAVRPSEGRAGGLDTPDSPESWFVPNRTSSSEGCSPPSKGLGATRTLTSPRGRLREARGKESLYFCSASPLPPTWPGSRASRGGLSFL